MEEIMKNKELRMDDDFRIAGYFTTGDDVVIEIYSDLYKEELFLEEEDD
jgi:hypothetical protein